MGNGNSKYVLSELQAEERRNKRAAGILSSDRSETRKELLRFCRQQSDLGELPTLIGLRQRKENERPQGKNTRHAPDRIADVQKRDNNRSAGRVGVVALQRTIAGTP